jgi:hypothetical protein
LTLNLANPARLSGKFIAIKAWVMQKMELFLQRGRRQLTG